MRCRTAGSSEIGERGDVGVAAFGGERVLGQVVGADADEVDERNGGPGVEREGGHFGHGADFESGRQFSGGASDLGGGVCEQGAGGSEFVDGGDHGEQHGNRVLHPGSDQCAELLFEDVGLVEAEP